MACATLKRSLDWESINQRPTKRRRCMPFGSSRQSSSTNLNKRRLYSQMNDSLDGHMNRYSLPLQGIASPSHLKPGQSAETDQQMFHTAASQMHMHSSFQSNDLQQFDPALSADSQVNAFPKITPEKMAQHVQEEIQRLANRRKQLQYQSDTGNECGAGGSSDPVGAKAALERMQDSESSGSEMGSESPRPVYTPPLQLGQHPGSPSSGIAAGGPNKLQQQQQEKALFTFKQVRLICERMMREQEDTLREQYNNILMNKLAEQYDIFVKFTYDQIQGRYDAAPSYLS